jgi:HTH-type transcriptional regulator / antitoxin HigA
MPRQSDTPSAPLRDENEYRAALLEAERFMHAASGTPEADRLDALVTAIQAYEAAHYPIEPPDPVSAILFRLEQMGRTPDDLAALIGRSEAESILSRREPLSLPIIRKLHHELGVSADVLIQEYELAEPA